ncbi:MAG: acetate--CoA ligase family protein [Ignavibacteriae bacterium]|nr:acetate--CoA ligase family protein [Ignavibacteriota bacterium]
MNSKIKHIFYPSSICVVGASSKEKSIGYELLKSIKEYSFTGKVFPVNPKADKVLDYKCYKNISEIYDKIDLAIIVVPKIFVESSINDLIKKKVKSIILITAGFRETGEEGKEQEVKIIEIIRKNNVRLVGPNCMGVINTLDNIKLNATFVAEKPKTGSVGFLSQSGALGAAVLNSLRETDIKFAHFLSVGNKADISENDIVKFWLEDKNINVITLYLESFENGFDFLKLVQQTKKRKPIIVLKAGKSDAGMKAASSHTGALSSNDKIIDALLKQFGIIRAKTLNEMFNTAKGFEHFPFPKGKNIAVVTNAGGPAILAVDKLEVRNLNLAELTDLTKSKLREIVHPEGSVNNPVDLLPGGSADLYKKVNEIILKDKNVDAIISIFVEPVMVNAFEVIESITSIKSDKPIYQVCMPLPEFWEKYRNESKLGLPIFRNPEDPAEIISNILLHQEKKNIKFQFGENKKYNKTDSLFLNQVEIDKICRKYNIPIVKNQILSLSQVENTKKIKYPLVLKGISKNVIHKSELDAVKLNLNNFDELLAALSEIKNSFKKNKIDLEKLLIQPYIATKHELLIGGFRDPSFGPIIMFGSGGKYVEVLNDTKIRSAYLSENDIDEMIFNTNIGKILKGVRGEKGINFTKLKSIISSSAKLLIENENVLEFDFNPIIIDQNDKLFAVDVRIKSIV